MAQRRKTKAKAAKPRRRRAPARRRCDCESRTQYRFTSEFIPVVHDKLYRYVLDVRSKCSCDGETRDHCMYHYWFEVRAEERRVNQDNEAEGPWQESPNHPALIRSIEIQDPLVRARIEHVPAVTSIVRHTAWKPFAPEKVATPVVVQVVPRPNSPEVVTVHETPELCVPRVPGPVCPEWV